MVYIISDKKTKYQEVCGEFIDHLQQSGKKVACIGMVALFDDPEQHDSMAMWNAGPFEMAAMGNALMLEAAVEMAINRISDDDDEAEAEDDD